LGTLASIRVECLAGDEEIDRVRFIGPLSTLLERKGEDAKVMPQPPIVRFVPCEPGAVDTRLLASAEADDGAVEGVADGI
jgi:hypothetical protein